MVGVVGKSKGCNTCRKRKIHVRIELRVAFYFQTRGKGAKSVGSVMDTGRSALDVGRGIGYAKDISANDLSRI
jgi:hypothetical protein